MITVRTIAAVLCLTVAAHAFAEESRPKVPFTGRYLFCWPPQLAIVEEQLVTMVDQYLQNTPSASDEMFSTVAAAALVAAFPCNKQ
jgi:hypothetical protein